jgi:hypothetical protein
MQMRKGSGRMLVVSYLARKLRGLLGRNNASIAVLHQLMSKDLAGAAYGAVLTLLLLSCVSA